MVAVGSKADISVGTHREESDSFIAEEISSGALCVYPLHMNESGRVSSDGERAPRDEGGSKD